MIDHILGHPRNLSAAGMGLGKTTATMTALDTMYLAGDLTGPTLVAAPLRVASTTWPDEVQKWRHLRHLEVTTIIGDAKARRAALQRSLKHGYANIYTINYDNLTWLEETLKDMGVIWPFQKIVADECTKLKGLRVSQKTSTKGKEYITGQGSLRAKSLARFAFRHATHFTGLTGTPAPNGLKDLWGQMWFVDGGARLGRTYSAFLNRWFKQGFDGHSIEPLPFAQEQIEDAIRDVCLALDIRDYVDIQEPITTNIYVDLPAKARRIYDEMEKKMFATIGEHQVEAFSAAAKTMKCLQLANGAAYVGESNEQWEEVHDAKLQALDDIIEEAAGMPVLVAYHFRSDLARLQKAFPKGRHLDKNPATIRDWNAGKIPVLFAHPASAGHGLNLQDGGNILVVWAHNWALEEYQQIIERIGPTRQLQAGHNRPMYLYHIIARDTIDEIVMARRDSKKEVQELLIEAMKKKGLK